MLVQSKQPRRSVIFLEIVHVFVCILLLHCLETGYIEVWEMFAVLSRSKRDAIMLCHLVCCECRSWEMKELSIKRNLYSTEPSLHVHDLLRPAAPSGNVPRPRPGDPHFCPNIPTTSPRNGPVGTEGRVTPPIRIQSHSALCVDR